MKVVKNIRSFGYQNLSDNFDIKADKRSFVSTSVFVEPEQVGFTRKDKKILEAAMASYSSNEYDAANVQITTYNGHAIIEVRNVHPTLEKLDDLFDKDAADEVLKALKMANIRASVRYSCVQRHIPGEYVNCALPLMNLKNY